MTPAREPRKLPTLNLSDLPFLAGTYYQLEATMTDSKYFTTTKKGKRGSRRLRQLFLSHQGLRSQVGRADPCREVPALLGML